MRKYLLTGALVLSIFGAQMVHADVAPDNQKLVTVCAEMKGVVALPKLVILAREGHVDQSAPAVTKVAEGDCVDLAYKFDSLDLYAVDATTAATLDLKTYDPASDAKAYKASMALDVTDLYVDPTSTLTYRHNGYVVAGVNNTNHQLVVLSAGYKTNLEDLMMTPNFPSGLSAAIGSQVDVSGPGLQKNVFTDVTSDSPYYNALIYLKTNGVISGYADGSFKPNSPINRAELTKIVHRTSDTTRDNGLCMEAYAKADGSYEDLFTDVITKDSPWYLNDLCLAKGTLIDGYPDGSFRPAQNINFVESSKIIAKAFNLQLAAAASTDPWYKVYVDALVTGKAIPRDIKTFDQNITRGQMAEIVYRVKTQNTTLSSQTYADLK